MKMSVCMITYNHAPYIAQAIESVMTQETPFDYELIIGEDFSTDGTRVIVRDFQRRFPGKIRLLLHEKNVGMMANVTSVLRECRGEYVAMLEGDDYWTVSGKLRKQADFLDGNPQCSICFHAVKVVFQDRSKEPVISNRGQKPLSTIEDLLAGNFIHTASCVFRNSLRGNLPPWFSQLSIGDWPLHVLNARTGMIGYLDEVMAIYRIHEGGSWMGQTDLFRLNQILKVYEYLDEHLEFRYHTIIREKVARRLQDAARLEKERGNHEAAERYLTMFRKVDSSMGDRGILFIRRHVPALYGALAAIKRKLSG